MTDNPILWVLLAIGAILLFVLLLAGITSLLTAFFGKRYALRLDKTYCGRMSALLPGEDCGACGYSQCSEYAEAALYMDADADRCPKMTAPVRSVCACRRNFSSCARTRHQSGKSEVPIKRKSGSDVRLTIPCIPIEIERFLCSILPVYPRRR